MLELEFIARFFKAAQSAGFDNFQAFVWYNQGKWPLESSKVKKYWLSLLVSKHAVLLYVGLGQHRTFVDYDSNVCFASAWTVRFYQYFFYWITSLIFLQFHESYLHQTKMVERWVTLFGFSSWSASFLVDPLLFTSNRSDTLALDFKYSVASSLQCQICYWLIHFSTLFLKIVPQTKKRRTLEDFNTFCSLILAYEARQEVKVELTYRAICYVPRMFCIVKFNTDKIRPTITFLWA